MGGWAYEIVEGVFGAKQQTLPLKKQRRGHFPKCFTHSFSVYAAWSLVSLPPCRTSQMATQQPLLYEGFMTKQGGQVKVYCSSLFLLLLLFTQPLTIDRLLFIYPSSHLSVQSWKKRYFVLHAASGDSPALLSYYKSQKVTNAAMSQQHA